MLKQKQLRIFFKTVLVVWVGIFPGLIFAAGDVLCSNSNYTVATINGVFTDDAGANDNMIALQNKLGFTHNNQKIKYQYLLNPSHLGGVGDIMMAAYQKIFDDETVRDYDLIEMLKSASEKVKTQKILLVAHSQGNFYANSFYDTVADKNGGVPAESIGIYSVATPAGRVGGGGKWLTSDTDRVIAGAVGRMPFKNIMKPNTRIALAEGDDTLGHNFSGVYLKHRGGEIVSDIQSSLSQLKASNVKDERKPCIDPPELTIAHRMEGAMLAVADRAADVGVVAVNTAATGAKSAATMAVKAVKQEASAIGTLAKLPFQSKEKILAENQTSAVASLFNEEKKKSSTESANSNAEHLFNVVNPSDNDAIDKISDQEKILFIQNYLRELARQAATADKMPSEIKMIKTDARTIRGDPKLWFVGSVSREPLTEVETAPQTESGPSDQNGGQTTLTLSSPIVRAPQCDYSLATDGCLLATTTVNFSWPAVSGATHYAINKNGEYATTTELFFTATAADFSDYTFSVAAISSVGATSTTSATSTKTVSVASIPLAINEIAWMGTVASPNDEWMELKNNTSHSIDLSQWVLESGSSTPHIVLSGAIAPHEYIVLERTDDTTTDIIARAIYIGALSNVGEQLSLLRLSVVFDQTPIGAWPAGYNSSTTRKTMERLDSKIFGDNQENWATWGTNVNFIKSGNDANGNYINGTPGACNSASYVNINNGQNITNNLTLPADNCYYVSENVQVSASSTLTIEAGGQVSLYLDSLVVNGALDVKGKSGNPIAFDSFSGSSTLNGIEFSGNVGTSTIDNAVIKNTGGVVLYGGAILEIKNTQFASTTNEAIAAYGGSVVSIASSTIANTLDAGAIGVYGSSLSMASTGIDTVYAGDGIGAYNSTVTISSSTINNVLDGDGIGVYDSTISIASSTISNIPEGDGIGLYSSTSTIANVVIENVGGENIAEYQ